MKTHTNRFVPPGGPRRGAGHPRRVAEEWRRQHRVSVLVSPRQQAELREIADAWNVPPATVIWALVESEVARARRTRPRLGDAGVALYAALRVLREKLDPAESRPFG